MTINKISYVGEKVSIDYSEKKNDNKFEDRIIQSNEKPLPSFLNALLKLRVFVLRMLEMPDKDSEIVRIHVQSVNFTFTTKRNVMGVVISATRSLLHSTASQPLKTPHKIVEPYKEGEIGNKKMLMDPVCVEYINELIEEAEKYVNGERAQEEMNFEEKEKTADKLLSTADDSKSKQGTFTNIHDIKEADEIKKKKGKKTNVSHPAFFIKSKGRYVDIAPGFANRLTVLIEQRIQLENFDLKKSLFSAGIGDHRIIFEKTGDVLDIMRIEILNHPAIEGDDLVKNVVEEAIEQIEQKVNLLSNVQVN